MQKTVLALFLSFSLSACGGADGSVVEMVEGQEFAPAEITVGVDETISFKNTSSEPHTVTAYDAEIPEGSDYFSSGGLPSEEAARDELAAALVGAGDSYEVTFEQPGTYRYFCIPHEEAGMKGTIVVEG